LLDFTITKEVIYGENDHGVIYEDVTGSDTAVHLIDDEEGREVLKMSRCSYENAGLNPVGFH
jgi:hypothetical protein